MEVWLEGLSMHISVNAEFPEDLKADIYNYTGKYSLFLLKRN